MGGIGNSDWKIIVNKMLACLSNGSGLEYLQSWIDSGQIISLCTILRAPFTDHE